MSLPSSATSLSDAVPRVAASPSPDPGAIVPQADVLVLEREVASIHNVWPSTRILTVAHSEAGLVAQFWWRDFWLGSGRNEAWSIFSLDGPLNGVANAGACQAGACTPLAIGRQVGAVWRNLWRANQSSVDRSLIAADEATGDRFIAVGTQSDPVYDLGDAPFNNGLGSQLWHTGRCVADRLSCDYRYPTDLSSACATNSTSGPTGSMDGHGLMMNCQTVEAAIRGRLESAEAAARVVPQAPAEPLNAISCAGVTCVAVGWYIHMYSDYVGPTPAIERLSRGAWRFEPSPIVSAATPGATGLDSVS